METTLIRVLMVLGVPGVALGLCYLLLRQFKFQFATIRKEWAAPIAALVVLIFGSITFFTLNKWAPQASVTETGYISYERFTVAWPIWAGGYPRQQDVLDLLDRRDDDMRRRLDRCLKNTLGESAKLEKLEPRGDGYVKIEGLSPSEPRENSVELDIMFRTAEHISDERRNFASSALAKEIEDFIGKYVRESWNGADIFDVNAVRIERN